MHPLFRHLTSGAPVWSCLAWSVSAMVFVVAATAWAQGGPAEVSVITDPSLSMLMELLRSGGLPAMIGAVAWFARGWLSSVRDMCSNLTVTVRLDDEARELLEELLNRSSEG